MKTNQGFTLLEVIAVLIIIALLAVVAVGRLSGDHGRLDKVSDSLKSHLRFAQKMALNLERPWGIEATGSSYWLFSGNSTTHKERLPGEDEETVGLPEPVRTDSFTICFDPDWGAPHDGTPPDKDNKLEADKTIEVRADSQTRVITVTPNTGFIP
ncbi:MAG: Tfp pilus assembly protein FimT/FimU [Desulfurivibrionaceae bacterium]